MKNLKLIKLFILAMSIVLFTSCDDDDEIQQPNIVELAQSSPSLSVLVDAVVQADLTGVLTGEGPYTVLAPTDTAFQTFLTDNGFASLSEVPNDVLTQILLNHVISGEVPSSALLSAGAGYTNTNASSPSDLNMSLYYNTSNGVTFNGVSTVTTADVYASNGIVHIVDAVIGLPTVVDFALADPNFETLVAALTRDDLTTDFVGTLSTSNGTAPAPFTVFAPSNQAFTDLLTELELASLNDIDEPTLNATLTYHVVGGANVTSSMVSTGTITTLGGDINAEVSGSSVSLTDDNDRVSSVIAVDVQASNGVIHAIDKVILPPL